MVYYVDVIIPIAVQQLFTYRINKAEYEYLQTGMRVVVPFGKKKYYTGIIAELHHRKPVAYEAKEIHQILDESPVVTPMQLKLWQWIAAYYMCTLGEVIKAAIPSSFLLQSETVILKNPDFKENEKLTDDAYLLLEALSIHNTLSVDDISKILSKKNVIPIIDKLVQINAIIVKEVIYEKYTPKIVSYIRMAPAWQSAEKLAELLETLQKAPKQKQVVLQYFQDRASQRKAVAYSWFIKKNSFSYNTVKTLIDKGIFEKYNLEEDRIKTGKAVENLPTLSPLQKKVFQKIQNFFHEEKPVLLHGVTGSGKTEIYMHFIQDFLAKGKQVLYLVPEIALTTQLINRLQKVFGDRISVFHSRYNLNERTEVWYHILNNRQKAQLIIGARSAVLLPFSDLGFIIIDEEHETSYKQFDPAPRYHARDLAVVLAKQFKAKVLLGSATPSIESYHNTQRKKYHIVSLKERYSKVLLPEIILINLSETYRKKQMKGHFSLDLLDEIQRVLQNHEQVILFQNRRGYAPIVSCTTCGVSPQCPNCDVSLTYHAYSDELRCHYCGFSDAMPKTCPACKNPTLDTKGFGTQQLEKEIKELFPKHKTTRMDFDTTRKKYDYHRIITAFQNREIDILIGTQMLSKGLDFSNVSLVGVLHADNMLNFPDFRAHERSFQMLLQVSGRAGRNKTRGKVIIQTFNPHHRILQQVSLNDYEGMYKEQITERWQYKYPPYFRLIKISLKHKDYHRVDQAAQWLGNSLKNSFNDWVLGPSSPAIGRVRNLYIKDLIIKIPLSESTVLVKRKLQKIKEHFLSINTYRSIRFNIDVDHY